MLKPKLGPSHMYLSPDRAKITGTIPNRQIQAAISRCEKARQDEFQERWARFQDQRGIRLAAQAGHPIEDWLPNATLLDLRWRYKERSRHWSYVNAALLERFGLDSLAVADPRASDR